MASDTKTIKYSYSFDEFSSKAAAHVFRYISALTGIRFIEDNEKPDISPGRRSGPEKELIEKISDHLSIESTLGPYGDHEVKLSKDRSRTLSELIGELIGALKTSGLVSRQLKNINLWPDNKRFGAAVTHDIDIARRSIPGSLRLLFHKRPSGRLNGLFDALKWKSGAARNPYDRVADWIDLEREFGIKSTYFIFAGERRHRDDPKYGLEDLDKTLDLIEQNGCEIALHSGIECYEGNFLAESKISLEKSVGSPIRGTRPHYMSADLQSYWKKAAESEFSYSSCLGSDIDIGYYQGIDLPIFPFDKSNDSPIDIVEIPLAIMDCGLIGDSAADSDEVIEKGKALIDRAETSGGLVVLDWHQRTLYAPDYPGWGKLFSKLFEYLVEKGAYFGAMSEIADLFRKRFEETN